jgi:hypothetical protein
MFGSNVLDVAIGVALIYLLLSLVSSSIREMIAGFFKTRAKLLKEGIDELLGDLAKAFYEHPQISVLYRGTYEKAKSAKDLPSYIPARNFALAVLDIARAGQGATNGQPASANNRALSAAERVFASANATPGSDAAEVQENLEAWFNSAMDRVSGWYKRRTQWVLFAIGFALTAIADADSIRIAKKLYRDPAQRSAAVAMAEGVIRAGKPGEPNAVDSVITRQAIARLDSLGLPVAWNGVNVKGLIPTTAEFKAIVAHAYESLIGWLITAFAISLGAPFWFDTLNRIMVIRSTVKPHEKSPEEASEDRQNAPD